MNTYIFYSIFFLLPFLQGKQRHPAFAKNDNIDSIIVYKLSPFDSYPVATDCKKLRTHKNAVKFNLTAFKNRIQFYLSNKKSFAGPNGFDAQSLVEIWYKSGKVDTLCTCSLPCMSVNREMFELGPDLNKLLDSIYYDSYNKHPDK